MTLDHHSGKVDLSYKALGKMALAMVVGATIPVATAMVVMYGDKRVMESTQAAQGVTIEKLGDRVERLGDKVENHGSRLTTLEAQTKIEE